MGRNGPTTLVFRKLTFQSCANPCSLQARYNAILDGKSVMYHGFQEQPEVFQDVLFKQTGLSTNAEHTLVRTGLTLRFQGTVSVRSLLSIIRVWRQTLSNNDAGWYFDVDYFIVQNEAENESQEYVMRFEIPDPRLAEG